MADIIIKNGTLITVDPERRIIENGAIAIEKDKIAAVGTTREVTKAYKAKKVINAKGMVVMPGLIDTHGHSGSSLAKNVGEHTTGSGWRLLFDHIFFRSVSEDFMYLEGQLGAVERLKFGTTCFIHMFGSAPRADKPIYAELNMRGIADVGLRHVTGVGPPRPPFPIVYSSWKKGKRYDSLGALEDGFKVAEKVIKKCHGMDNGRTNVWVAVSRPQAPSSHDPMFKPEYLKISHKQSKMIKNLMEKYGVGFHTHAYGGVVKWCYEELNLLGPDVLLGHCTALSEQELKYLQETDTKVAHCPTARRIYSFPGHCLVPEMIDMGISVSIATDNTGMDRTVDQFKDMKVAILLQRLRFRDPSYMPPGKVIEMVTIDAARNLGMDKIIGSLEVGKKADVILINMQQPHLIPTWMIPQRVVYQVTGHDVDTVLVDGKVLMEGRKVKTVNENRLMRSAQKEAELMMERSGLEPLMELPDKFWGHSRY